MADERRVDRSAPRVEKRPERLRGDSAVAARSCVEERHDAIRLDDVRGSIADGERRHFEERRRVRFHAETDRDARHDRDRGELRHDPNAAASRDDRADPRDREQQHEDRRRSSHDERSACRRKRDLHEPDLQPCEEPEHRPGRRRQRCPQHSKDSLRIRERERRRGERCAEKGQRRPLEMHRAEVGEDDRRARDERSGAGGERARKLVARDPRESRPRPPVVARKPAEPARTDWPGEMAKREHADEAQLEPGIERVHRTRGEHRHRRDRDDRIAVPVPSPQCAERSDDRHERRPGRARGRSHEDKRRDGRATDGKRPQPRARGHERCGTSHDPSEDGEVEARAREDVREPHRAERLLDRSIPILDIAKDERDEHRPHAVRPVALRGLRHSRQKPGAKPLAEHATDARESVE